jgi:hypothetical protein
MDFLSLSPGLLDTNKVGVPCHTTLIDLVWFGELKPAAPDENFCSAALAFLKGDRPGRREKESKVR